MYVHIDHTLRTWRLMIHSTTNAAWWKLFAECQKAAIHRPPNVVVRPTEYFNNNSYYISNNNRYPIGPIGPITFKLPLISSFNWLSAFFLLCISHYISNLIFKFLPDTDQPKVLVTTIFFVRTEFFKSPLVDRFSTLPKWSFYIYPCQICILILTTCHIIW